MVILNDLQDNLYSVFFVIPAFLRSGLFLHSLYDLSKDYFFVAAFATIEAKAHRAITFGSTIS